MKQRLRQLLDELHTELADAHNVEVADRDELMDLADTISLVAGDDADQDWGQLQQTVLEFETEHPQITGILARIADTLAKLGI